MIAQTTFGIRGMVAILAAAVLFLGVSFAAAQTTTYTPPSGFSAYGSNGIFYNSSTGQYYNPMTGQTSTLAPLGPASMNNGGQYIVGSGYVSTGSQGLYYNASTGYYYDPTTGFYSTVAPTNTGVTATQAIAAGQTSGTGTGGTVITPGVPNTGTGGDAEMSLALLVLTAALAAAGSIYLGRQVMKA